MPNVFHRKFLGNARLSKLCRIVRRLKFTCSDPQDVPYNPAEQGQVGQLSNRYIVISRLIRYEGLFISCSGCVTISHKIVLEHVRHSGIANHFASAYRKITQGDLRRITGANRALRSESATRIGPPKCNTS